MKYTELRDFLFRGLLFEAEATTFQNGGIKIGADQTETEQKLLAEALAPFPINLRNSSLEMARLYAVLFAFENHIREFIRATLSENEGVAWANHLPQKIMTHAEKRQNIALKDSWLEGEKNDILRFCDFGHLADIILNKWIYFESIIPSQNWLKQRMDELEKSRNFIAHHRMLLSGEFQRMYMYIADWNRIVGL